MTVDELINKMTSVIPSRENVRHLASGSRNVTVARKGIGKTRAAKPKRQGKG